ncbi:hypothetical protein C8A00DRAFT_37352 [Chaetomidium leptoderma]|uniref:Uncharacterized protein n=1 Tax=Chaetomidium leptoderma TaxID=669021 RepID=A0AAN6VGF5_9PEZI|nr:hypothetical protein C8A00DRAFT_37352 [Chaetomidium leptoderma]
MASADNNDKAKVRAKIDARRASILGAIRNAYPKLPTGDWLATKVALVQQNTLSALFDRYKDPECLLGADYVAWRVDSRLRQHFGRLLDDQAAARAFLDDMPNPTDGPYSQAFHRYQLARLALEEKGGTSPQAEPKPQPPKPAGVHTSQGPEKATKEQQAATISELAVTVQKRLEARKRKVSTENKDAAELGAPTKKARQQPSKAGAIRIVVNKTTTTTTKEQGHELPKESEIAAAIPPGNKGKGAASFGTYLGPFNGDDDPSKIGARLDVLSRRAVPRNSQIWPKFVWRSLYDLTPPPQGGDFFALPIRDEWAPLVSPDVLIRVHNLVEPTIRVVVHSRGHLQRGRPRSKLLAVLFTDYGNPTSVRELGHLAQAWSDIREWHRHMMENGDSQCALDDFMRERQLYKVSVGFAGNGVV